MKDRLREQANAPAIGQLRASTTRIDKFAAADAVLLGERKIEEPVSVQHQVIELPLGHVHDNDWNARVWYDEEFVARLAAEIAADGQTVPAIVVPHPTIPGEYMLVEGHYRKRALRHLSRDSILAIIRQDWAGEKDRFAQSWKANEHRLANSPVDNAIQWSRAIEQSLVRDQEELAKMLAVPASTVSKVIAIGKLGRAALDMAARKPAVWSMASLYQLALLHKEHPSEDIIAIMQTAEREGWVSRDIQNLQQRLARRQTRKPRTISRQYRMAATGHRGFIKEWDSGRVLLDLQFVDPAAREGFVRQLRQQLGGA